MHGGDGMSGGSVVYLYDGSLAGFFCCVYESVYGRELPADILPEDEAEPSLFTEKYIETDPERATRVRDSVSIKISPRASELVRNVFLSCMEKKEVAILRFLLRAYREGPGLLYKLGDPDIAPLIEAERHLLGERHKLLGFVRFADYGGTLASTISPKNFVLPYLAKHFATRFSEERFMIYDSVHKAALIYQDRRAEIVPIDGLTLPEASEGELMYQSLWKRFYDTIAIETRENPRCRMTHMPKRYWENMTEMKDLL